MAVWAERSQRYLGHKSYSGGHFYVNEHAAAVLSDFARRLGRVS